MRLSRLLSWLLAGIQQKIQNRIAGSQNHISFWQYSSPSHAGSLIATCFNKGRSCPATVRLFSIMRSCLSVALRLLKTMLPSCRKISRTFYAYVCLLWAFSVLLSSTERLLLCWSVEVKVSLSYHEWNFMRLLDTEFNALMNVFLRNWLENSH